MNIFFGTLAILSASGVRGYALPGACSGICTNTHDPSIITRNGIYFRFSTGGRIAIHIAPNITGPWTYKGPLLPKGSIINLRGNQDLWAPDVSEVDGTYYLYYSVSTFGSQTSTIGVAVSNDLENWTDLGSTGITSDPSKPYNAIDANLIDVNGTKLLTFGSFWNGLYQVQMQTPPTSARTGSTPYQISHNQADKAMEGPTVFRNGGYYYLFFSKGSCCGYDKNMPAAGKEYKILVCRSTSPTGGFVDKSGVSCTSGGGTVVLESHSGWVYGPGGQCVYDDPVQGPILGYHYVDRRIGYADGQKRFGWNKMDFSDGWPVV
ncbi:glycosyl hydrolase [Cercophora newfieldiana]|uniref:Arabinan endo-1,5-alpha-L-arabinosidase n=1 Tax=Cercophora newfieldiana TaxID=92897 RepID=A0AA39YC82_9PEZI|nr:glycosyl hydrolase [Cercophora newfieldiana]